MCAYLFVCLFYSVAAIYVATVFMSAVLAPSVRTGRVSWSTPFDNYLVPTNKHRSVLPP